VDEETEARVQVQQAIVEINPIRTRVWIELEIDGDLDITHGITELLQELTMKKIVRFHYTDKECDCDVTKP